MDALRGGGCGRAVRRRRVKLAGVEVPSGMTGKMHRHAIGVGDPRARTADVRPESLDPGGRLFQPLTRLVTLRSRTHQHSLSLTALAERRLGVYDGGVRHARLCKHTLASCDLQSTSSTFGYARLVVQRMKGAVHRPACSSPRQFGRFSRQRLSSRHSHRLHALAYSKKTSLPSPLGRSLRACFIKV
jgi:hypothetical protein